MSVTDPIDARLLAALAEHGKAPVHELAARLGMDPRDVAYRLVTLSGSGLPLLVGVECDAQALRAALGGGHAQPGSPSGGHPTQGTPSGPYQPPGQVTHPQQGWYPQGPAASGPYAVPPSGAYPAPPAAAHGTPSGPYSASGTPSGAYSPPGAPSGPYQVSGAAAGAPSGPYPAAGSGPYATSGAPVTTSPSTSGPHPSASATPDPVIRTWGPPQTASWARGDQPPAPAATATAPATATQRTGRIGDALDSQGLDGEQLRLQLLEVQDPADYLFSAAGYRLADGERAIVVHTEITNVGRIPFDSLPDNYLELLSDDDTPISKAAISLTSRPPHRIGVKPGETLGGHTVYVLPETTTVRAVRWSPRPEPDERTLTWMIDD